MAETPATPPADPTKTVVPVLPQPEPSKEDDGKTQNGKQQVPPEPGGAISNVVPSLSHHMCRLLTK